MIPSTVLRCGHPLLTVFLGSATAKDNGTNYEGEGITGSKPAHDWIFSRWNLGGGNGLGNRAGALSLLFFLILVVYVILVTAYLLYSIRLKKQGDERAARIAQGYVYPESKLTKWLRSTRRMMIGWQR